MFIKLTRLDGSPIWINAAFVVTVEPRKAGGSIVVPVGDGLDYDVREEAASVLALLGDAPTPAILPIPTTDALKASPVPEAPEKSGERAAAPEAEAQEGSAEVPADDGKKTAKRVRKTAAATAKKPRASRKKASEPPLPEDQVERLRKMGPKSVKKLQNTLATQFRIEDAEAAVAALEANGVFDRDGDRVIWK